MMNSVSGSTKESREEKSVAFPCAYYEWNDTLRKEKLHRPAVDCEMDCAQCGWNPSVAKTRVRKMKQEYGKRSGPAPALPSQKAHDEDA